MKLSGSTQLIISLFVLSLHLISCNYQHMEADLIIHNAKIYTLDENNSMAEAMAIKDGKIAAVGAEREILNKYRAAKTIDAGKQPVYPGFIDAHCHFLWYGQFLNEVDLTGTKSLNDIVEKLSNASPNQGEWITGRGWDQNDWPEKSFPDRSLLDSLFPDTPVYLVRIDGHAAWVNSKALEIAQIKGDEEITGGEVITSEGVPTGILIDRAMELVKAHFPAETKEDVARFITMAEEKCFAEGITSLCDAGLPAKTIRQMMELDQEGKVKMNIHQMLAPDEEAEDIMRNGYLKSEHISVRALKLFADGALGSRGAAMLEPYTDDPDNTGLFLNDPGFYQKWASIAHETNYQLCTHAIGDAGNRMALDLYSKFLDPRNDRRWRIEHAQVLHPDDFNRFGELTIIPSVQPTHATSDMGWAGSRLGAERLRYSYAFEELRQQLGMIPLGTDFPIEGISPLDTFFSAVFRKNKQGEPAGGFQMENALSREHTLRGMTIWAAIANFQEDERGTLESGKAADVVILNRDLMTAEQGEFKNIDVKYTLVNGEVVYQDF
jgi:predicted amidohydrolase YtcJ